MLDLVDRFKGMSPSRIAMTTVPLGENLRDPELGDVLTWDKTESAALFAAIAADQPIIPKKSTAPKATVAPAGIKVSVLNGTEIAGLAATASRDLAAVGFQVVGTPGNAPAVVGEKTVIRYDERWSESVKTVAASLPGAELVAVKGLGPTFEITVGTGYTTAKKVTVVPAAPTSSATPRTAADDICA
jgi:hypothetical protein